MRCIIPGEMPVHVLGTHAEVVLQKAADPQRGRLHVFLHPDALAFQVGRGADAGLRVDPHVLVAKAARRINRDAHEAPVATRVQHHEGRERKLRRVELCVPPLAAERLHRHHGQEVEVDSFDGDAAVFQAEGAVVKAAGEGDGEFHDFNFPRVVPANNARMRHRTLGECA